MKKKEWEPERLFEVFQSAVEEKEKFQLAEGAPENFYDLEPLYLVSHFTLSDRGKKEITVMFF